MSLGRILPLPSDVVAKIQSSTSITHLSGVIVELVKNSLDANAHTVYVTVDFQRGGCVVEDDGDGIPTEEFESNGSLGKKHHTSRFRSKRTVYGRKGLFLASLSSLSLLTIVSNHVHQPSTNAIIFHHAAPVARLIPAPAQQHLRLGSHGTCVTVNDLFGNMPVRVKNRALAMQKPDEPDRQWDALRQLLVSLVIANDSFTKLVLADASKGRRLTIRPRPAPLPADGELDIQRISSILNQAGLIDPKRVDCWDTVSACVPDFSLHAAICLVPSPTKKVQFISMGINPIFPRNNANLLYGEINRIFSSSNFGGLHPPPSATDKGRQISGASPQFVARAVNKWPMFCLRISMKDHDKITIDGDEVLPEADKSMQRVMDVLSAMLTAFLAQHNLSPCPRRGTGSANREPAGTDSLNKYDTAPEISRNVTGIEENLDGHPKIPARSRSVPMARRRFENWSRIKSAKEPFDIRSAFAEKKSPVYQYRDTSREKAVVAAPAEKAPWPSSRILGTSSSETEEQFNNPHSTGGGENDDSTVDTNVPWTDPYTGRTHLINSRTGQSMCTAESRAEVHDRRPHSTGSLLSSISIGPVINRPKSATLNGTQNVWIENLLQRWENPVFRRSERPINAVDIGELTLTPNKRSRDGLSGPCRPETPGLSKLRGKLQRQDLKSIEIIAQVDQKFIFAKSRAPSGPGSVLVLIDQHAADERCRVEKLCDGLFELGNGLRRVRTIPVDPIVFDIAGREAPLFYRYKVFFGSWGVSYVVKPDTVRRDATVSVYTLPSLIAERCRAEPNFVTDLIRGEIWRREEDGQDPREFSLTRGLENSEDGSWVARMNGCPQGVIDLLNSRACRTAIMFNDPLTVDECQSLVDRLSRCVFPFQCAHGRPSMIPILDIGDSLGLERSEEEYGDELEPLGFIEAFERWNPDILSFAA